MPERVQNFLSWCADTYPQLVAAVSGIVATIYGWSKWARHSVRRLSNGLSAAISLHSSFGLEAGAALRKLIEGNNQFIDLLKLEIRLKEQFNDIGVYRCDADGLCIEASPHLCDMFRLSQADMMGHGWTASIRDNQTAYHRWKFAKENRLPYSDVYFVQPKAEGSPCFWVSTLAVPVYADDGKTLLSFLGIVKRLASKPEGANA